MDDVQTFLADNSVSEEIAKAAQLNDIESKNDPDTDPYKSKYKAREIWQDLKNSIDKVATDISDERWSFLLAGLDMRLGINFIETEELSTGEERLSKCLETLKDHRMDKRTCTTVQQVLNHLGILWASRRRPENALKYLEDAQTLYNEYKHEVGNAPHKPEEIFKVSKEGEEDTLLKDREERFESTYTHTLYYLAQVYGKLEENDKSAQYCHVTLRRQLDSMKYDPMDWALNAATLSQYYITRENFTMARHCLASATVIISEVEEPSVPPNIDPESEEAINTKEKIPRSKADIKRCWVKYCIALLEASRDKLYKELEDEDAAEGRGANDQDANDKESNDVKSNLFFNLEVTAQEDMVTDKFLNVFDSAREVFLAGQKWLNAGKEFYVLDGHCTDHVELIQDHSKLFKVLAFFEMDFERQCKMHKRRIDMLEAILKELSAQFYLLICRQLIYEVAETYSAMLDLKLSIIEERGATPSPHAVKKINHLAEQSIKKYEEYIDTLRNAQKKIPEKFCEDDERPALVAYFCMGRLHSKFLHPELEKRLTNLKNSLECYKFLVDYCRKHESAAIKMKAEFPVCEEMVTLLPAKMSRIQAEAAY